MKKTPITEIDLDIASDDESNENVLDLVKKAMDMGLFNKLENEGPNGFPLIHLKGEREKVEGWIRSFYDATFEMEILDTHTRNHWTK